MFQRIICQVFVQALSLTRVESTAAIFQLYYVSFDVYSLTGENKQIVVIFQPFPPVATHLSRANPGLLMLRSTITREVLNHDLEHGAQLSVHQIHFPRLLFLFLIFPEQQEVGHGKNTKRSARNELILN